MNSKLRKTLPLLAMTSVVSAFAQFTPNIVMEEATGEWCGWCPRGIVGTDKMLQQYPDGSFIPIAVHDNDEFHLSAYRDYMQTTGFPQADFQRTYLGQSINFNIMNHLYEKLRSVTVPAKIEVTSSYSASDRIISVRTLSTFAADVSSPYSIAIVLTENGVVGNYQANNYAGGAYGEMGGFENMEHTIFNYEFNHVARYIYPDYYGDILVSRVSEGDEFEKNFEIPIPRNIRNVENVDIIALLLSEGKIVNAASAPLFSTDAIAAISCDEEDEYFTLTGIKVDAPEKGIYLIRRNGSTYKVIL